MAADIVKIFQTILVLIAFIVLAGLGFVALCALSLLRMMGVAP